MKSLPSLPTSRHVLDDAGFGREFRQEITHAVGSVVTGVIVALGLAVTGKVLIAGIVLLATLVLGGGFWAAITVRPKNLPLWVETGPAGLRWANAAGEHACSWEEIVEVYRTEQIVPPRITKRKIRIVLKSGESLLVNQRLNQSKEFADVVQAATLEVLAPEKRAVLASGVDFGPVLLSSTGIRFGPATFKSGVTIREKFYPFSEIDELVLENGCLIVVARKRMKTVSEAIPLSEIPNYLVLFLLLGELNQSPIPSKYNRA